MTPLQHETATTGVHRPPARPPQPTCAPATLDVRPESDFLAGHHPDAAHIPLEDLATRIHELSRRDTPLRVFDTNAIRARWARSRLRVRGFESVALSEPTTNELIAGPAKVHLWQPHDLLIEALRIIGTRDVANPAEGHPPMTSGTAHGERPRPRAADLACGTGRDLVYLAMSGWDATGMDILPDALQRARELAARNGVQIATRAIDLEGEMPPMSESFDLITVFNFLHRPLWRWVRDALRPGGWFVCETFVAPQYERFGKPRRPALILQPGELVAAFGDWIIHAYGEGLAGPRRIVASLIAQKPASPRPTPQNRSTAS